MSGIADVGTNDFIGETLDTLTDLCRSCGELSDPAKELDCRRSIERGFHTIKGNSLSFGFEQFSELASRMLYMVRSDSQSDAESRGAGVAPLVLEFVTRSRQYLGLVRDDASKRHEFFGGIFQSLQDQLEVGRHQDPAGTSGGAPGARASLGERIRGILAAAPPVHPDIAELSRIAAKRLKSRQKGGENGREKGREKGRGKGREKGRGKGRGAPPPETPRPEVPEISTAADQGGGDRGRTDAAPARDHHPITKSVPEEPAVPRSVSDVAPPEASGGEFNTDMLGFAFEALCARAAALTVKEQLSEMPQLSRQLSRVARFLTAFSRWTLEHRMVPLDGFLDQSADEVRTLIEHSGLEVGVSVEGADVRLLPLVGQFLQRALVDIIRGLLPLDKESSETGLSLILSATSGPEEVAIRISGTALPRGSAVGLRVYAVKRRLQEIGGDLVTDASGHLVKVPQNSQSADVVLVRSGPNVVGIPGHRVIFGIQLSRADIKGVEDHGLYSYADRRVPVVDLREMRREDAAGTEPEEHYLVVLDTETGGCGLLVDEILKREEMLVLLNPKVYPGDEILGFCFSESDQRSAPIFDFQVPQSMRTEDKR